MATRTGWTQGPRMRHLRALAVCGAVFALLTLGTASASARIVERDGKVTQSYDDHDLGLELRLPDAGRRRVDRPGQGPTSTRRIPASSS